MKTLEQLKNDYSVSKGYIDFDDLLINVINYEILSEQINEIMKIYAMECLELASLNVDYEYTFLYSSERNVGDEVAKQIKNENNIIK